MATQISITDYDAQRFRKIVKLGGTTEELREQLRGEVEDVDSMNFDQLLACQIGFLKYALGIVVRKLGEADDDPQARIDREQYERLAQANGS